MRRLRAAEPPGDLEAVARRAARGDRAAFGLLCGAIEHDIWRYCLAVLRNQPDADDATQETFVRLVPAIRRFRGEAPVRVWALVIARRVCSDSIRRRSSRPIPVDAGTHQPAATSGAHEMVEASALLAGLDEEPRTAFVLTQLLGLSYAETAQVCEIPLGTVRSRVHRARCELAERWMADEEDTQVLRRTRRKGGRQ